MSHVGLSVKRHRVFRRVYGPAAAPQTSALGDGFPETLAGALTATGAPGGYWLVRRLDVETVVGAGWSPGQVAGAVARRLVGELHEMLLAGTDPGGVLWFPDRATFVSRYLLDLAEHRVSGRWEYAQFAGLPSDTAEALTRLAAEEPHVVLDALLQLTVPELERVVGHLGRGQTSDVVQALTATSAGMLPRAGGVLEATRTLLAGGRLTPAAATGLRIALLAAGQEGGAAAFSSVAGPATEVAALVELLGTAGTRADELVTAVAERRWADAVRLTGPGGADVLLPLVRWGSTERTELCRLLAGAPSGATEAAHRLHTPFGGMFLLLPLLDELWDWEDATRPWPTLLGVPAARWTRLVVTGAALGRGSSTAPLFDPVLRLALDIPESFDARCLSTALRDLDRAALDGLLAAARGRLVEDADEYVALAPPFTPAPAVGVLERAATSLLRALARRLPGMADASAPYLGRNVLDLDAHVTVGADRFVVVLGNPPLHVLLTMTGMNRGSHRWGRTGDRTWTLTTTG